MRLVETIGVVPVLLPVLRTSVAWVFGTVSLLRTGLPPNYSRMSHRLPPRHCSRSHSQRIVLLGVGGESCPSVCFWPSDSWIWKPVWLHAIHVVRLLCARRVVVNSMVGRRFLKFPYFFAVSVNLVFCVWLLWPFVVAPVWLR